MARTSVFREHIMEAEDVVPTQPATMEKTAHSSDRINHFTRRVLKFTIRTKNRIQSYLYESTSELSLKRPCIRQQCTPVAEEKEERSSTYRGFDAVEYILMPMYGPTPSELDGPGTHFYIQGSDPAVPVDKLFAH